MTLREELIRRAKEKIESLAALGMFVAGFGTLFSVPGLIAAIAYLAIGSQWSWVGFGNVLSVAGVFLGLMALIGLALIMTDPRGRENALATCHEMGWALMK